MLTVLNFLTMPTKDVFKEFKTLGPCQYKQGKYLHIDNKNPITLVAHADTLAKERIKLSINNNIITNQHGILGADDRAGCYAIWKIYTDRLAHGVSLPNILITDLEECGGVGAKQASKDLDFTGTKLFIELDRQGCNEYVYYTESLPKEIIGYVESFGYVENYGSYSDIAEFEDRRIPAVNLSIGYYRQHTTKESLHLDEVFLTISRVNEMLNCPPKKLYLVDDYSSYKLKLFKTGSKKTKKPKVEFNWSNLESTSQEDFPPWYMTDRTEENHCFSCGEELEEDYCHNCQIYQ